jgi:hypothetical protein
MAIKFLFPLILFITAIHLLITPIRFIGGFNPNSLILITYLIISMVFFFLFFEKKLFFKLKKLEIFIIVLPIFSLLITFSIDNPLSHHILMDILKPILFISTIVYFKYIDLKNLIQIRNKIKYLMYFILFGGLLSIFTLVYLYTTRGGFYLSATNILILIPTFYFIVKKNKIPMLIATVGILYSGKRGVLLALLISLFTMYLAKVKNYKKLIRFWFFASIILSTFILLTLNGYFDNFLIVKKIMTGINASEGKNILFAFGGRAEEVLSAVKIFYKEPILLLTGAGVGYTYNMETMFGLELENVHGVHFSPIGIFTIYGPFFFIALYSYLIINLKRAYIILKKYNGDCILIKTGALFVIANFIASFTAFSIFTPIYFAIFIGLINNIHIKGIK